MVTYAGVSTGRNTASSLGVLAVLGRDRVGGEGEGKESKEDRLGVHGA